MLPFLDITDDTKQTYRLKENEQAVFFMLNRSGTLTFELSGNGATAHVFAFFIGTKQEEGALVISQQHLAPRTTSRVLVKSVLHDESRFSYRGTLHIAPTAALSDASQENRNLLLSPLAKAFSEPSLEILTDDVRCRHAATTSSLNQEALFFAQARGLTPLAAQTLLIDGFLFSSAETLGSLVSSQEKEKVLALLRQAL